MKTRSLDFLIQPRPCLLLEKEKMKGKGEDGNPESAFLPVFSSCYTADQRRERPIRATNRLSIKMVNQQLFGVYLENYNGDSSVHGGNSLGLCEYQVHQETT